MTSIVAKKYLLRATEAQGLAEKITITALADDVKNWCSIVNALEGHRKELDRILDWFQIEKKF